MYKGCSDTKTARHIDNSRRHKLWQLPTCTHCPIIGTCLSLDELSRAARQPGLSPTRDNAYMLHSSLVQLASQNLLPIRRIQKMLDSKYARWIKTYDKLETDLERTRFWRNALKSGQVPGAFWALVSHRETPPELIDQALSDVHMLSHLQGAANRADLKYLARLEQELQELKARLERQQRQHQASQQQSRQLIAAQEKALHNLRQQLGANRPDHSRLQQELDCTRRRYTLVNRQKNWAFKQLQRQHARIAELEEKQQQLQSQLQEITQERDALESSMENLLQPTADGSQTVTQPCLDLHGRKLAYVGGRTALLPRLKSFVEAHNGQLYCHDGGIENNRLELCKCLYRADLVFCPVDCVSHNACLQVKKFCKRHSKRFIPLRSASIAAFTCKLKQTCESRSTDQFPSS